jgi:hypothetical protein
MWWVKKEANVRQWSRTAAIEVINSLNMQFLIKILFPLTISDADQTRPACTYIMRQFICAPNLRSLKRDADRTRKKSVGL